MENNLVRLKLKQRLNKLASSDFTNLECWQEAEIINKARLQWVRRNLHGGNEYREGDEQSISRIDDFQILLTQQDIKGSNHDLFFETVELPANYLKFKRITVMGYTKECTKPRRISVQLVAEADVDNLLGDTLLKPSFKWAETFCTLIGNQIRVYTNKDFIVKTCKLTYYRMPKEIAFDGCRDWNDKVMVAQELEFNDSLIEQILDEAAGIAAADMNDYNNFSRSSGSVQANN